MLFDFWREQETNECRILLTNTLPSYLHKGLPPCVRVDFGLFNDMERLRLQILKQKSLVQRQIRKDRHYEERILRILNILRDLQKGLVRTRELAQKFQVTPRTIQRDISILERLGEPISYDEREKAFFLVNRESLL